MLSSGGDVTSISYKKTKDIRLATSENRDTETFTSVGLAGVQHCEHTGHGFQGLTYAPSSGCGYLQSCCRTCWYRRYRTRTWSRTDSSSFCKRESGPVRSGGDTSGTTKYRIPRDPAPRCYGKPAISSQSPEPTAARSRPQPRCAYGPADAEASTAGRRGSAMPRDRPRRRQREGLAGDGTRPFGSPLEPTADGATRGRLKAPDTERPALAHRTAQRASRSTARRSAAHGAGRASLRRRRSPRGGNSACAGAGRALLRLRCVERGSKSGSGSFLIWCSGRKKACRKYVQRFWLRIDFGNFSHAVNSFSLQKVYYTL